MALAAPPVPSQAMAQLVSGSEHIELAVAELHASRPVVIPTETVYGLAAPTFDERAIEAVFRLKGRPMDNPLIAHVVDAAAARQVVASWDDRADRLAAACWPGPLTLVLPKASRVPSLATGGRCTVAVRSPDHPVAQALLKAFDGPISAPSANRSGCVSPTQASHVINDYADVPEASSLLVLDGGACSRGVESTVLDLTTEHPHILRVGTISAQTIVSIIGRIQETPLPQHQTHSPGTRCRHYAPQTPIELIDGADVASRLAGSCGTQCVFGPAGTDVQPPHMFMERPPDPTAAEACLYAQLRAADVLSPTCLLIVLPPDEPQWSTIRDRLTRAAAPRNTTRD